MEVGYLVTSPHICGWDPSERFHPQIRAEPPEPVMRYSRVWNSSSICATKFTRLSSRRLPQRQRFWAHSRVVTFEATV